MGHLPVILKENILSHFAKVENGIVTQVMVVDWETLNQEGHPWGDPSLFVQTSYNTHGGQHPEGRPLRFNYAGIGYSYDSVRDAFIPPKPFPSWVLDETTCLWNAPVAMPTDGSMYTWSEDTLAWVAVTQGA